MIFKLLFLIVILAVTAYLAWSRSRSRGRAFSEIAQKYGLEASPRTLDGTVRERAIHAHRVRKGQVHRGRFRHARYLIRFEVELRSAPGDLRLATEGAVSTLAKVAGFSDIRVGDERFDSEFLVRCASDQSALVWLSPARRGALMALRQVVEQISVEDGRLAFDIPADPYEAEEIEAALNFAVGMAEHIDAPSAGTQPALEIHGLRGPRGKWSGMMFFIVSALSALTLGGMLLLYFVFGATQSEELDARNEERQEHSGGGLVSCIEGLELTWDVDLSVCADEVAAADPHLSEAIKPLRTYHELRLRKATRVDLDPAAAASAIKDIIAVSRSQEGHAEQLRYTWDAGLAEKYAELETWEEPAMKPTSRSLAILGGMTDRIGRMLAHDVPTMAAQCLVRLEPLGRPSYTAGQQVAIACQAVVPREDGEPPFPISADRDEEHVAKLEADPDAHLEAEGARLLEAPQQRPNAALYVAALELARGTKPGDLPLEAIAEAAAPARCAGAWGPGESFGDPEVWRKAARVAGPALADIMRTHAIAQDHAMGRFDALEGGLETDDPQLAICVAQMEIAAGDPAAALARLDDLEPPSELAPWVHYTRAQAQFMQRQWGPAAKQAVAALEGFPLTAEHRPLRSAAALFAVAAQLHARDPDVERVLEQRLGPRLAMDEIPVDDAVAVARWFTDPAREDFPDSDVRWGAPATFPLIDGAEVASFHIASEFAKDANVEYWLDTLVGFEFDPFGVATGRLLAAKLRDDAAAEKSWAAVQSRLQALVDSPSAVVLRRHAFP